MLDGATVLRPFQRDNSDAVVEFRISDPAIFIIALRSLLVPVRLIYRVRCLDTGVVSNAKSKQHYHALFILSISKTEMALQ